MIKNGLTIKLSLAVLSTLLSLCITELFLTFFVNKFEAISIFTSSESDSNAPAVDADRHDDIYELYQSSSNQYEVVTIGDSYTNGGNVNWNETYPYKLFLNLDKKITVINMGICEDTTRGSLLRLTDYFRKKNVEKNNKKTIVAVLVGAADVFFENNEDFENIYKKIIDNNEIPTEVMPTKLNGINNFMSNLKTIKMLSYVILKIKNEIKKYIYSAHIEVFDREKIDRCYITDIGDKNKCLVDYFQQVNNLPNKRNEVKIYRNILNYLIYKNQNDMMASEKIVSDILLLTKIIPKSLILPDIIYNVVRYGTMQSKFDMESDILAPLNVSYQSEKKYIKDHSYLELDNAENILRALMTWSKSNNEMEDLQKKYFTDIYDLVKNNNGYLVLINYPRAYKKINNLIKNFSIEKKIPFINLEYIFNKKINSGINSSQLIGDWEHCTPEGYGLIASSVYTEIVNLINE